MNIKEFSAASASTKALNPGIFGAPPEAIPPATPAAPARGHKKMNKTEREYSLFLDAEIKESLIVRWEYEGITLRWADMKYTPDFFVVARPGRFKCIEVKGGHIWDRDIVRFKGARHYWPEFEFEMWQKSAGEWRRLH